MNKASRDDAKHNNYMDKNRKILDNYMEPEATSNVYSHRVHSLT